MACERYLKIHDKKKMFSFVYISRDMRFQSDLQATNDFFCGSNVSQRPTFLLSELWPAVATKLHEPKNTKSEMPLLWHWYVCLKKM